jgi:hypothetical protein
MFRCDHQHVLPSVQSCVTPSDYPRCLPISRPKIALRMEHTARRATRKHLMLRQQLRSTCKSYSMQLSER